MPGPSAPEDFELVPLRQIEELKEELARIKDTPIPGPKKLELSLEETSAKLDKLIAIFEDASHAMKVEDSGLTVSGMMKMLSERLDKVADQNQEIAKAMVALADMISDLKSKSNEPPPRMGYGMPQGGLGLPQTPPPLFPPGQGGMIPPPPFPPKKR